MLDFDWDWVPCPSLSRTCFNCTKFSRVGRAKQAPSFNEKYLMQIVEQEIVVADLGLVFRIQFTLYPVLRTTYSLFLI